HTHTSLQLQTIVFLSHWLACSAFTPTPILYSGEKITLNTVYTSTIYHIKIISYSLRAPPCFI
ncbi:MAG: hypothetical protein LBV57_01310, partial [Candidatus Symbiothrix sp.]|nr:hypothetical protein [Candidatus Symbiothrix sp.]